MAITVNLWSKKSGEIKMFLEKYYDRCLLLDDDVLNWIYVYKKPLDAVDLISAVMDNNSQHNILMCIQVNDGDLHPITSDNYNDVIKGMFDLFFEENYELIS
jgi:hypothetical protein